jgi:hypothetical protein
MKIYSTTGSPYLWFILAFLITAIMTSLAFLCLIPFFLNHFQGFCHIFGWLGSFATLFGPILLMPLFWVLILTQKLGPLFYHKDEFLILLTKVSLACAALLCIILFIVPITTLDVPYRWVSFISNPTLKTILKTFLFSLWLAPAGMLMMLTLFMIQFGLLRDTLVQGFKPVLIYIVSGGLTAFTFGIFATILGNLGFSHFYVHFPFNLEMDKLDPMVRSVFNPLHSLVLDIISPLPMFYLFKKCILDKIEI